MPNKFLLSSLTPEKFILRKRMSLFFLYVKYKGRLLIKLSLGWFLLIQWGLEQ